MNSALQLGLLIALVSIPLWAYVAVTFFVAGLVVPVVTTAPVLLYGDAVARSNDTSNALMEPTNVPA